MSNPFSRDPLSDFIANTASRPESDPVKEALDFARRISKVPSHPSETPQGANSSDVDYGWTNVFSSPPARAPQMTNVPIEQVLAYLRRTTEKITAADIAKATGLRLDTALQAIETAARFGLVIHQRTSEGRVLVELTEDGRSAI